jgi:hypothetical protein
LFTGGNALQYYRITISEEGGLWGDTCTFWFEIDTDGDAARQIQIFPNGYILSYDANHLYDEYDGLKQMVIDGDAAWWEQYHITQNAFDAEWARHHPVNRPAPVASQLTPLPIGIVPRFPPAPTNMDDDVLPF